MGGASTTSECTTLAAAIDSEADVTDGQICACMSSDDFSALADYDCKMGPDDSQNVSLYQSGGGVCSSDSGSGGDCGSGDGSGDGDNSGSGDDSSSSALSVVFAFAALFFGLA